MEHEDLLDASVEVLAGDTQPEESAASLTKRIMNKLHFSSNRVTETVLDTQNITYLVCYIIIIIGIMHMHIAHNSCLMCCNSSSRSFGSTLKANTPAHKIESKKIENRGNE